MVLMENSNSEKLKTSLVEIEDVLSDHTLNIDNNTHPILWIIFIVTYVSTFQSS